MAKDPNSADKTKASVPTECADIQEPAKKKGAVSRLKGFFASKSAKNEQKRLEDERKKLEEAAKKETDARVAATLYKIDDQLNALSGYNLTLLNQIEVLRESNALLLAQINKSRKRETVSKIIAIVSWVVSGSLIVLKIINWLFDYNILGI